MNHERCFTGINPSHSCLSSPAVLERVTLSFGWGRGLTIGVGLPNDIRSVLFDILILELRTCRDGGGDLPDWIVCR